LACEWETLFIDKVKTKNSAIVLIKIDLVKRLYFLGKSAELAKSTTLCVVAMDHLIRQDTLKSRDEEWLKRMDQYLASIKPIKEPTYGKDQAVKWTFYRRTFFIAVAELFA
jgi:(S)-coclaurine N-methyltransferase